MRAKRVFESEKIMFKGTPAYVSSEDLRDPKVSKLFLYKDPELEELLKTSTGLTWVVKKSDLEDVLKENIAGGGGAGYAVYGGGWGRSFGNPSMGGRFTGRGFGFGGSANVGGGPNIMYTYTVKPLNKTLEPPASSRTEEETIHVGSLIKGKVLGKDEEVIGTVVAIGEDGDNNINWYMILDPQYGNKKKIDPTSAEIHAPEFDELKDDDFKKDLEYEEEVEESFYPSLKTFLNENRISKETEDVEDKVRKSKNLPSEMKEKILPLVIKAGIHGTRYKQGGYVFYLKYLKDNEDNGCDLGADKNGFFVFTHRARSKSYPEIEKIPQKDIKFIKSTG